MAANAASSSANAFSLAVSSSKLLAFVPFNALELKLKESKHPFTKAAKSTDELKLR
jgi:hypothetical protein